MEIIKPLTEFYNIINSRGDILENVKIAIKTTHDFRRQQLDIENYYTNFTHMIHQGNNIVNGEDFLNHLEKIRNVRAYFKVLLSGLNNFENVLYKIQIKDNRKGVIPTLSQLYTLVNVPYKKNISVNILDDEKMIDDVLFKVKPDLNMVTCYSNIPLGNYNILKNYIYRYSVILNSPTGYIENEKSMHVKNRVKSSYFNLRQTTLNRSEIENLYKLTS